MDRAKSPGVDPKQLAAELQKVSLQQSPLVLSSVVEKGSHVHSGPTSAGSSSVPSPGQPGSFKEQLRKAEGLIFGFRNKLCADMTQEGRCRNEMAFSVIFYLCLRWALKHKAGN